MCLDGSPPGYYIRAGFGDGANKWILYLMGGGWCSDTRECSRTASTRLGSTSRQPSQTSFHGILSSDSEDNQDFYNWNAVHFVYCDGGSFAGDRQVPRNTSAALLH